MPLHTSQEVVVSGIWYVRIPISGHTCEVVHLVGGSMDTMPGYLSWVHTSYHHIWGCTPRIWSIWVLGRYHHIWHILVPCGGYPQDAISGHLLGGCQDTHIRTPHLRWYIWWVDLWIPCQDTSQEVPTSYHHIWVAHHIWSIWVLGLLQVLRTLTGCTTP